MPISKIIATGAKIVAKSGNCQQVISNSEKIVETIARGWKTPVSKVIEKINNLTSRYMTEVKTFKNSEGKSADFVIFKGSQQGSNEGYWVKLKDKDILCYAKFGDKENIHSENLATQLYELAGVPCTKTKIITAPITSRKYLWDPKEKTGILSKYMPFDKNIGLEDATKAREGFGVDCWLANWDALKAGNTVMMDGKAVRLDVGGSLCFRAQGSRKTNFNENVTELTSFFDGFSQSKRYLQGMTRLELINSLIKVGKISDDKIIELINKSSYKKVLTNVYDDKIGMFTMRTVDSAEGITNPEFLKEILIARKKYIKEFALKCMLMPQKTGESIEAYVRRIDVMMPKTKYLIPFDKIPMSENVRGGKLSLGQCLTISQKKMYEDSYKSYSLSRKAEIKHLNSGNGNITTDTMLHATSYSESTFKSLLDQGITTGDTRSLAQSGTGVATQTPLCADFWDVTKSVSIKEYFSKPTKEFAPGELNFLPSKNSSNGGNMVFVIDKKSVNPTVMGNSFMVSKLDDTILQKDNNIAGHMDYRTHRAVPIGVPANSIEKIIIRKEKFTSDKIAEMKRIIAYKKLDIKIYDLDGNLL